MSRWYQEPMQEALCKIPGLPQTAYYLRFEGAGRAQVRKDDATHTPPSTRKHWYRLSLATVISDQLLQSPEVSIREWHQDAEFGYKITIAKRWKQPFWNKRCTKIIFQAFLFPYDAAAFDEGTLNESNRVRRKCSNNINIIYTAFRLAR
jgi:hypothetical protein